MFFEFVGNTAQAGGESIEIERDLFPGKAIAKYDYAKSRWVATSAPAESPEQPNAVWGRNERYVFTIFRASPKETWKVETIATLDKLTETIPKDRLREWPAPSATHYPSQFMDAISWDSRPMDIRLLLDPRTTIQSVSQNDDEVVVEYNRLQENLSEHGKGDMVAGKLALSKHYWGLPNWGEESAEFNSFFRRSDVEYEFDGNLLVNCKRKCLNEFVKQGENKSKVETRITRHQYGSLDPREFYLSHYGLPEPPGTQSRFSTRTWVVVAFGIGFLFVSYRLLRKNLSN